MKWIQKKITNINFFRWIDQDRWKENKEWVKCGFDEQSPITVIQEALVPAKFEPFKFEGFEKHACNMTLTHTGHSIKISTCHDHIISGGGLNGKFKLDHVHFHWGPYFYY